MTFILDSIAKLLLDGKAFFNELNNKTLAYLAV